MASVMASARPEKVLETKRHIQYWSRCLNSVLPNGYTSTDSSRMTLGFFILSALDLLDVGPDTFSPERRTEIRDWILKCQHPSGGFCGSTNHKYPDEYYEEGKGTDPANLPATFFALLSLGFVGGLGEVDRSRCREWLRGLQRKDGSFGELRTLDGKIQGGRDMRYCYTATAVRWMLATEGGEGDINVERLVRHLRNGQVCVLT